jgi:hypothetical protein
MMNKAYKIHRIKERGYKIIFLGKRIKAIKGSDVIIGTINYVFKQLFGY